MLPPMKQARQIAPALAGPLLVMFGLQVLGSAPFVFVAYHLVLCLLVPWWWSRREGLSTARHAESLGLERRGLQLGLALALVSALVPPLAWLAWPSLFPDAARLQGALADWGLGSAAPGSYLFFLALVNGPAEELFWRGWLLRDRMAPALRTRVLLAALFTSYHAITIGRLAPSKTAAALMLAGIFAAALFWTWSRLRWRSVWPALLSHTGATCGYLFICARLLERG